MAPSGYSRGMIRRQACRCDAGRRQPKNCFLEREAMTANNEKAVLHYPGGEYEMDIIRSTEGYSGVVLGNMLAETNLVSFDPGYVSTGSTESKITYIDGEQGILRHRGYDIADLAQNATFNEVCYLLIKGEAAESAGVGAFQ